MVKVIAEVGVNHNGSLDIAKQMVDKIKAAGVDVAKFQIYKTELLADKDLGMTEYQTENMNESLSQYELLQKYEMHPEQIRELKDYCDQLEIEFLATPFDDASYHFLVHELKQSTIKIGSGDMKNHLYLAKIAKTPEVKHLIISTGMATIEDVKKSLAVLEKYGYQGEYSLLHCTTNYPCLDNEINLLSMDELWQLADIVGYSDHSAGNLAAIAAVARGAKIIEKHFTLDREMDGPDHLASETFEVFKEMVDSIRRVEKMLGAHTKKPQQSEQEIEKKITRCLFALKPIKKGEQFTLENVSSKRSEYGIPSIRFEEIIGKTAQEDIDYLTVITEKHF